MADPFVQVLQVAPDVVPAVEDDGYEGSREAVPARASVPGLAVSAVERLTGFRSGPEHLAEIDARDAAHRILPWLDEHQPERRLPDGSWGWAGHGPLGADTDRLVALPDEVLPDEVLAELAWSGARALAERAGLLADEPAAGESLVGRRLTPPAERLARESMLAAGEQVAGWDVLHEATNPHPLAAAVSVLGEVAQTLGERGLVAAREVVAATS